MIRITLRDITTNQIDYSQQLEVLECVIKPFLLTAQQLSGKQSLGQAVTRSPESNSLRPTAVETSGTSEYQRFLTLMNNQI